MSVKVQPERFVIQGEVYVGHGVNTWADLTQRTLADKTWKLVWDCCVASSNVDMQHTFFHQDFLIS